MNELTDALEHASTVLDHASIVTTAFVAYRDSVTDDEWDALTDGPMSDLIDALTDLEYEVES